MGGKIVLEFKDDNTISTTTVSNLTGESKPSDFVFRSYMIEGDSLFLNNELWSHAFQENGHVLILRGPEFRIQLTK
jgi:hypothetical protein